MSLNTDLITPKDSRLTLLGLPWEIREQIYQDYFKINGGYVYDGGSDKLVEASGQPIDLSLRYTCRSIANETRHFPFSLNSITFSTLYRQDMRKQAAFLGSLLCHHLVLAQDLLVRLRRLVTPDMYTQLALQFPRSAPVIKEMIDERLANDERRDGPATEFYRVSNSRRALCLETSGLVHGEFYDTTVSCLKATPHALRLIAERHPTGFLEAIDEILPEWSNSHEFHEFFDLTFDPWAIPSLSEIMAVAEGLQMPKAWYDLADWYQRDERRPGYRGPTYRYRGRYRFTAAAVAIRFLGRMPPDQRLLLQNIVVNEDRVGTSYPECHAVGLIPFCKENPRLHIEQRISLWRNLVVASEPHSPAHMAYLVECYEPSSDDDQTYQIERIGMSEHFATWVMSVLEVLKEGMPSESYTCIIDGKPDLNLSTELLSTVLSPDIAWLTLHTECVARGIFTDRSHREYPFMTRVSAEDIEPLESRSSIIQCNFTLDQPWDYDKIAEDAGPHFNHPGLGFWLCMLPQDPMNFDVSTHTLDLMELKLETCDREKLSDGID